MVEIYRQKYDILKIIENIAYGASSVMLWGTLFLVVFTATYLLGWYGDIGRTLLGQFMSLI